MVPRIAQQPVNGAKSLKKPAHRSQSFAGASPFDVAVDFLVAAPSLLREAILSAEEDSGVLRSFVRTTLNGLISLLDCSDESNEIGDDGDTIRDRHSSNPQSVVYMV